MLELIKEVANKVVKKQFPLAGENRYSTYDIATILHSYIIVMEHINEVSKKEEESKLSPTTD